MDIVKISKYPLKNYFQTNCVKKRIALHHTCGYSADGAISSWRERTDRVGTPYVVERDGKIYQVFDDAFYAWQFGLSNNPRRTEIEQSSIGIEIVNLGYLIKLQNNTFADMYGRAYKGEVFDNKTPWRGYRYWHPYSEAQYIAVANLINMLSQKHDIPIRINHSIDFDMSAVDKYTIFNHANVRKDKTDLSPAFDFNKLEQLTLTKFLI